MFKNLNLDALGIAGRESELIELTLSYGFQGFDLDIIAFGKEVERSGIDRARRLIDSARLKFGSFLLPIDYDGDDESFQSELKRLAPLAALAEKLGCERCWTTISPAGWRMRRIHWPTERCRVPTAPIPHEPQPNVSSV